jgi:TatD DNase family protein
VRACHATDGKAALPPSIIMHSYGGTAGMMDSLTTMKNGIGSRFYFSFSPVINMRSPKTVEVIKHVPVDRLLIETDQNTPTAIEGDIMVSAHVRRHVCLLLLRLSANQ